MIKYLFDSKHEVFKSNQKGGINLASSVYDKIQSAIEDINDMNLKQSEDDLRYELDLIVNKLEKAQEMIY